MLTFFAFVKVNMTDSLYHPGPLALKKYMKQIIKNKIADFSFTQKT